MKPWMKKGLILVSFGVVYAVCLVIFLTVTFPFARATERICLAYQKEQSAKGTPSRLSIGGMRSSLITGIELSDVRLTSQPTDPKKPSTEIVIDRALARISILSLLTGKKSVTFDADLLGGSVRGKFVDHALFGPPAPKPGDQPSDKKPQPDRELELTLSTLDLAKFEPITKGMQLPIAGSLSGTVKIQAPGGQTAKANGTLSLEVKEFTVGDGKTALMSALTLPPMKVGTLSFEAEAKDGALKLSKFGASGGDLEISADGRIELRGDLMLSNANVGLKIKFSDAYKNKDDKTKLIFVATGGVPPIIDMAPQTKNAKRPDGSYAWNVRGMLQNPQFVPSTAQ